MTLRHHDPSSSAGFTLIEIVMVVVILSILAAAALPKLLDLDRAARISALNSVAGSVRSTVTMVKAKAHAAGLSPASSNPDGSGGSSQAGYLVNFPFGTTEVDWRNLCPESEAELSDKLTMLDFITVSGGLASRTNNRYTLIGFDIPAGFSVPTDQGCYVIYDSFGPGGSSGTTDCTVTVVTSDC